MKKVSKDDKSELTKYGGQLITMISVPTAGSLPVKMDGSYYSYSDDEPYGEGDKPRDFRVSTSEDIEMFIKACHCNETDYVRWQEASKLDMSSHFEDRHYVEDLFKEVKLHPEPVRAPGLCQALKSGSLVMASEMTDYLFIIYIGNDFTQVLKKRIEECRETGACTFSVTSKAFAAQRASRCRTCFGDDLGMAICDNCVATCHKGHDTYVVAQPNKRRGGKKSRGRRFTVKKTLMYCDCGHKLNCKCL